MSFSRSVGFGLALLTLVTCRDDSPVSPTPPPEPPDPGTNSVELVLVGAGNIARCDANGHQAQTAALLDGLPEATVFTAGDNVQGTGASDLSSCFNTDWGRHLARMRPAAGERDYQVSSGTAYFDYFGARAGEPGKGYYSYEYGRWHVVVLNDNIAMAAGSAQEQWLRADLAGHPKQCTLAYWHHPRFSSVRNSQPPAGVDALWEALYDYGADLVLNAHDMVYERFAPQAPDGSADSTNGIRQFTVGTGGQGSDAFGPPRPNSQVRSTGTYGVVKLALAPTHYGWEFLPVAGQSFADSGATNCHLQTPVDTVAVTPSAQTIREGATLQLTALASDSNGNPLDGRRMVWSSSDTSRAQVDSKGLVVARSNYGSVTITAATGGKHGSAVVTVTAIPVGSVAITPQTASIPTSGVLQLDVTVADAAGNPLTGRLVSWTSMATGVAGVNQQGTVIALTTGQARVIATSEAHADTALITVTSAPGPAILAGAGDIASCDRTSQEATAKLLDQIPGTVVVIGDNAYNQGTYEEYIQCYDPSWGRHKARTKPAPGNHEYPTGSTAGAPGYFQYFGAAAGDPAKGYYSYDLGGWHIIVLNSNLVVTAGSPQDQWLRADLAAHPAVCTLAYWHHPLFSSGNQITPGMQPLWQALYEYGADLVLNGHDHTYERFAPQTPTGVRDDVNGIREIVVGTGGNSLYGWAGGPIANSEVRNNTTYGVIKVTLWPTSYDWEFIPVAGGTFTDKAAAPVTPPRRSRTRRRSPTRVVRMSPRPPQYWMAARHAILTTTPRSRIPGTWETGRPRLLQPSTTPTRAMGSTSFR